MPLPQQEVSSRAWNRCGLNGGLESTAESRKTGGWWISMYSTKGENTFHIREEGFQNWAQIFARLIHVRSAPVWKWEDMISKKLVYVS